MSIVVDISAPPRAFLTCAARSQSSLAPLLDAAELALLDLGWRTRLPRRSPPKGSTELEERRRLRLSTYDDVQRANVMIHVPAGARLAGTRLHHELTQALRGQVPVLLLVAARTRQELGLELPSPERISRLVALCGARIVEDLDELEPLLEGLRTNWRGVRRNA